MSVDVRSSSGAQPAKPPKKLDSEEDSLDSSSSVADGKVERPSALPPAMTMYRSLTGQLNNIIAKSGVHHWRTCVLRANSIR